MSAQYDVAVDRDTCIGSGMCRNTAPAVFTADTGGQTTATSPVAADEEVLDAAETCPVEAITVTDATSGEVLAPEE